MTINPLVNNPDDWFLVVHHTGDDPSITMEQEQVSQITSGRFKDYIAYNIYIEEDGKVKQGRPYTVKNGANHGLNFASFSIAMAGNFHIKDENGNPCKPKSEQIHSLVQVLATLCNRHGIPTKNIIGHCDVWKISKNRDDATSCPGQYFISDLPQVIEQVKKYIK